MKFSFFHYFTLFFLFNKTLNFKLNFITIKVVSSKPTFELSEITDEMKKFSAVDALVKARKQKHISNRNKYDKAAIEAAKKKEELKKKSQVKKIKK